MLRSVTPHRFAANGPARRLVGLSLLIALVASPALSQQAGPPPAQPGPGQPIGPGSDIPGQPNAGEAPAAQPLPDATEAAPDQGKAAVTGPELPEDFTAPGPKHESMTINSPLMTAEEIAREDQELARYNRTGVATVIRVGDPTNENKQAVRRWARLQMAKMTAASDWRELNALTKPLMLSLRSAALAQQNAARRREFREALAAAMTEACTEVLDNNFYVRLQAITILYQLDIVPEEMQGRNPKPPVTYVPAMQPLIEVLANEDQPPAVKVAAAKGIARLADNAELIPAEVKYAAGDALTKELARKDTFWWYDVRLAEALAAIELDRNRNGQPIIVDALLAVIADPERHCLSRTAAAKAIARTRLPAGAFNDKAAADRIVRLAHDMSLAYNKEPERVHWIECYANLYMSFVPADEQELARLPSDSLLRRGSLPPALEDARSRIMPVVKHVLGTQTRGRAISQEMIQRLNEPIAVAD